MLARAGSEAHGSDQTKIYVPTDAEYGYYTKLINGFLTQLAPWINIGKAFEEDVKAALRANHPEEEVEPGTENDEDYHGSFGVFQTPEGSIILPTSYTYVKRLKHPDELMHVFTDRSFQPSRKISLFARLEISVGPAGKALFTDADNAPIDQIGISTKRGSAPDFQELSISALPNPLGIYRGGMSGCDVLYNFNDGVLAVAGKPKRWYPPRFGDNRKGRMSDAYARWLFDTIGSILDKATVLPPQTETSVSEVPPALLALPGRRPAAGQ